MPFTYCLPCPPLLYIFQCMYICRVGFSSGRYQGRADGHGLVWVCDHINWFPSHINSEQWTVNSEGSVGLSAKGAWGCTLMYIMTHLKLFKVMVGSCSSYLQSSGEHWPNPLSADQWLPAPLISLLAGCYERGGATPISIESPEFPFPFHVNCDFSCTFHRQLCIWREACRSNCCVRASQGR